MTEGCPALSNAKWGRLEKMVATNVSTTMSSLFPLNGSEGDILAPRKDSVLPTTSHFLVLVSTDDPLPNILSGVANGDFANALFPPALMSWPSLRRRASPHPLGQASPF